MDNIEIYVKRIGDYTIFETAFSKLTKNNSLSFKNKVATLLQDDIQYILLDLTSVEEIDPEGLTSLIALQRMCLYKSIKIRLYGLSQPVADIIYRSRMNRIFDICNEPFVSTSQRHVFNNIKNI